MKKKRSKKDGQEPHTQRRPMHVLATWLPREIAGIIICFFACSIRVDVPNFPAARVLNFQRYILYKPGRFVCAFTTTTKTQQHNVHPYPRQKQKTVRLRLRPPKPVSPISPHFRLQRHRIAISISYHPKGCLLPSGVDQSANLSSFI